MLTVRQRLISVAALAAVLGLAVLWLLAGRAPQKAVGAGASVPPQAVGAANLERQRHEIRVGREFELEDLMRLDSESAPWLNGLLEKYPADGVRAGEGVRQPEQVAAAEQRRGGAR